ncbi:hypothetical protein F3W84_06315 [Ochrobactrum quorumnocens]|uniref:Uncharacterized protein n=1 Tax=Ochrobactrum quorumnocens TaxID=271865 RepID=A0A5N1K2J5_9HYPH|nr:hypothetical protein F3W84_06315 [[Ochrobactrum] quorumnocens]
MARGCHHLQRRTRSGSGKGKTWPVKSARAVPVKTELLEPLYRFAFKHYPTQKAHSLLLEML